jgi:hypothetical protein
MKYYVKVQEEWNITHTVKWRKANRTGHSLRRNCLIKRVIEGKTEVAGRRVRRRRKTLRKGEDTLN